MASRKMVFGRYDYAAFLSFAGYAACSVVIPQALTQIGTDLNFPLAQGGMAAGGALQLGRSIPMVIAMLLCGFIGGRWGKYRTLGIALLVMSGGILLAACSPWYLVMFAAIAFAGLGEGVIEGLATPFVQDLHPDEPGRYINFTHSFWSVGVLGMVMVAGVLLACGVSWRVVVGFAGAIGIIPALMLLLPDRRAGARPGSAEVLKAGVVWRQSVEIIKIPRFWVFFAAMFLAGGGEFCLTFWVASFLKLEYGVNELFAALATGCFAFGMIVGRMGWGYWIRQEYLKQLVVFSAIGGTLISVFLPMMSSLPNRTLSLSLLMGMLALCGLATAPYWPSVQSYCTDRMPKQDATMLFVLLSCAGIPGCGFFSWFMGVLGDRCGLSMAFYIVPVCYSLLAALIGFEWWRGVCEQRSLAAAAGTKEKGDAEATL